MRAKLKVCTGQVFFFPLLLPTPTDSPSHSCMTLSTSTHDSFLLKIPLLRAAGRLEIADTQLFSRTALEDQILCKTTEKCLLLLKEKRNQLVLLKDEEKLLQRGSDTKYMDVYPLWFQSIVNGPCTPCRPCISG